MSKQLVEEFEEMKKIWPELKDTKLFFSYPFPPFLSLFTGGFYSNTFDIIIINKLMPSNLQRFVLYHEIRHCIQFGMFGERSYKAHKRYSQRKLTYRLLENDANNFARKVTGQKSYAKITIFKMFGYKLSICIGVPE